MRETIHSPANSFNERGTMGRENPAIAQRCASHVGVLGVGLLIALIGCTAPLAESPLVSQSAETATTDACCTPAAVSSEPAPCEPKPLDLLRLVRTDDDTAVELSVLSNTTGPCSVTVLEPAALRFADGTREVTFRLEEGAPPLMLSLRTSDGSVLARAAVQITVFDKQGAPWFVIDEVLEAPRDLSGTAASDRTRERVPVIFELPGGRRAVEYMTRAEAARRGLEELAPPPAADAVKGEGR